MTNPVIDPDQGTTTIEPENEDQPETAPDDTSKDGNTGGSGSGSAIDSGTSGSGSAIDTGDKGSGSGGNPETGETEFKKDTENNK